MGSSKHSGVYDPLDLEILDRVYEAAWARFEAAVPRRDLTQEDQRREAIRQLVFALASGHPVDLISCLKSWTPCPCPGSRP